ncbi:nuclear transport factor 2 family protein [Proteiniphilum sp. X52]|uniref:nuclear transport factor 2 family protein n=1 Tax=Proteiniphilum sp. X52 TaxID=2382159 RepID=UPI001C86EB87|nr:nuclear transport factor 2 family protein [Proteiniphilum sp. X52]
MKLIIIALLLSTSLSGCAQNSLSTQDTTVMEQQMTNDEAQILALTRKFTQLMIDRNTAELDKMVDKDFSLTHITGYVQPKAEWFKEIEQESMKYYSAEEVSRSITVNGDTAEFVQRNLLDARIWGSRNKWRLQQTMTLEKRNGTWIILKSVARTF